MSRVVHNPTEVGEILSLGVKIKNGITNLKRMKKWLIPALGKNDTGSKRS